MLRRKNYWLLFAILLLALTGLSPSMELDTNEGSFPRNQPLNQSERPASGEQGAVQSLHVRVSLNNEELRELERINSNYTLSSGVEVILSNVDSEETAENLKNDLTVGESPDIIMTDGRNIPELATSGYLLPVDVYQSVPGSSPLTVLIPQMQWNGYDWGVPLDIDPYVLVYSPARLQELGLEQAPKSLEDWNVILGQLREEQKAEKYLLALDTRNPYGFSAVLKSMGSAGWSSGDDEALEWTQYARSYFYFTSRFNEEIWNLLQEGRLAVAALPLSEWQKHGNSSLAAELPPIDGSTANNYMYSRFFALPAESDNPEAAVEWLAYITSSSAQLEWLENTGRLPALDALYRTGLPEIAGLPFDAGQLLSDEAVTGEDTAGRWGEISGAVKSLLTGELDAAGFKEMLAQESE
ncbi:hypothetical protein C2I18_04610 [Paenibacillus sp. PK3_47]|uniref:extracellular solute-binding protein n=1 Tax=Paenibacillus sp. PK3_47 TaxID=2072642 RepID=UPI00201E3C34|nr:extracellular solute-binding protein [Paenibacillus sp. PK3_47]UQZ32901.1 hypothetical protein C2I18_04610 [Paenibacillus sp. PK3_47]